jgi:hypothetical protein
MGELAGPIDQNEADIRLLCRLMRPDQRGQAARVAEREARAVDLRPAEALVPAVAQQPGQLVEQRGRAVQVEVARHHEADAVRAQPHRPRDRRLRPVSGLTHLATSRHGASLRAIRLRLPAGSLLNPPGR